MQPRQMRDTLRPVRPRRTYSIVHSPSVAVLFWNDLDQIAAIIMISTFHSGPTSFDSTVARAGECPFGSHSAQALFMSAKVEMSESQMFAFRILVLSLPACFKVSSICFKTF